MRESPSGTPLTALWMGTQETYYVAERTLAYIGGVIAGRESADQVSSVRSTKADG